MLIRSRPAWAGRGGRFDFELRAARAGDRGQGRVWAAPRAAQLLLQQAATDSTSRHRTTTAVTAPPPRRQPGTSRFLFGVSTATRSPQRLRIHTVAGCSTGCGDWLPCRAQQPDVLPACWCWATT